MTKKTKGKPSRINDSKDLLDSQKKQKSVIEIIFNNIVVLIIFGIIFFSLYKNNKGYNWMVDTLLVQNYQMMKKNPNLNYDQKMSAKIGRVYEFYKILRDSTPENALILMPSKSLVEQTDSKLNLKNISNKRYSAYFTYPRKLLYQQITEDSILIKEQKYTHVAILKGVGYEKLNYPVEKKLYFDVKPVNK